MKNTRGFTLIEILVVLTIIGILTAVVYVGLNEARENSQNKALRSEIKSTQLALEVYRSQFGSYPDVPSDACVSSGGGVATAASTACGADDYIVGLVPDFIADLPDHDDASNTSCSIRYSVEASDQTWYKLTAVNCIGGADTAAEGIQPNTEFARCPSTCPTCAGDTYNASYVGSAPFYESIAVYSDGGQCE